MRCPRGENDLMRFCCIDVPLDNGPSFFVFVRSLLGERVHTPMDIGVVIVVVIRNDINDLLRCLGCCRIVQIHQGFSIDLSFKDGKVVTNVGYLKHNLILSCKDTRYVRENSTDFPAF